MKSALLAAALLAATSSAALAESVWPGEPVGEDIRALPFVKAYAYAEAIDRFCFADREYATSDLFGMASDQAHMLQDVAVLVDAASIQAKAERTAVDHLKRDQSACAPAMAFVDKAVASMPEMKPKMAAMRQAFEGDRAAREEAEAKAKAKTEAERETTETIAACTLSVETATEFLAEGKSLKFTTFVESLSGCIKEIPETPATAKLLADAKAVLARVNAKIAADGSAGPSASGLVEIVDGDGILFGEIEVRLQGIAAPEYRRNRHDPGGQESMAHLRALIAGQPVDCYFDGTKTRGRPVGACFVRGLDIGLMQVEAGHARDCPRYSRGRYADAERRAIAAGRDLSAAYPLPSYCTPR
jgi:endonuclease YncB( thermonuclease family)